METRLACAQNRITCVLEVIFFSSFPKKTFCIDLSVNLYQGCGVSSLGPIFLINEDHH